MTRLLILAVLAMVVASPARADDFMALCQASGIGTAADKVCACTAANIPASERDSAVSALRVMAQAMTTGKEPDPAKIPPDIARGMSALLQAQLKCQ